MQDFSVVVSGATLEEWTDSRINSIVGHPQRHYVGTVGDQIEIRATVGGVDGPLDSALGGRLFNCWRAEGPAVFPITHDSGRSSVQSFTPYAIGHYTLGIARESGGAVLVHIDVEAA